SYGDWSSDVCSSDLPPGKPRVFRSIFLKTLRDYRVAILGWGIGMGLVMVSPMASVATLINTPQARAALATLATQFAWNADPIARSEERRVGKEGEAR